MFPSKIVFEPEEIQEDELKIGLEMEYYIGHFPLVIRQRIGKLLTLRDHTASQEEVVNFFKEGIEAIPFVISFEEDDPNYEIITKPLPLRLWTKYEFLIQETLRRLELWHFRCNGYTNCDLNLDRDKVTAKDAANLVKFFYDNRLLLLNMSNRQQGDLDRADMEFLLPTKKDLRDCLKSYENYSKTTFVRSGVHLHETRVEIKWFGSTFCFKDVLCSSELVLSAINFMKDSSDTSIKKYLAFLTENAIEYKNVYNKIREEPLLYLEFPI